MQIDQPAPTGNTSPHTPDPQQPNQHSENRQSAATDMQDETTPAAPDGAQEQTNDQALEQSVDDDVENDDSDDSDDTVTEASMESFPASDPPAWR